MDAGRNDWRIQMTQAGFWRQFPLSDSRDIMRGSRGLGLMSRTFFLFPQGGGPRGAFTFTTFADLAGHLRSRDVIVLGGVLREQAVAPLDVYDVSIIGASNAPRQATSGGVPTGGGATWMPPASGAVAATPLLELRAQGWFISGIKFTPHTSSAAVRLTSSLTVDTIDASHATFEDCYFGGEGGSGQIGIEDLLGCSFITIRGCRFNLLTGTAILALGTGVRVPLNNLYEDNRFSQNTNDIKMSLNYSVIQRNHFMTSGSGATNKVISDTFIAAQGGFNHIYLNQFSNTEVEIAPGNGYTGAATDVWMNYVNNQAALAFGQPA